MKRRGLIAAAVAVSVSAAMAPTASAEADYILATASTGGTYYPVGVASQP